MNIKFVSYTGKWPTLCNGILTLDIDGTLYTFGPMMSDAQYPRFWRTGGTCILHRNGPCYTEKGNWIINKNDLPTELQEYSDYIEYLFNKNVEHGCCGGCA